MTQMPAALPPHEQQVQTIIRDKHGDEVLRTGMTVTTVMLPDGTLKEQKLSEDIETTDGVSWNPTMRFTQNPVHLVVCSTCRAPGGSRRASHGLCTATNVRRCVACGDSCCPRHIRLCSDERHRCLQCARRHRFRSWFTWLVSTPLDNQ